MTAYLRKNCSFGLLCVSFVDVCVFLCVLLSLLALRVIGLIPDHYLSINLEDLNKIRQLKSSRF